MFFVEGIAAVQSVEAHVASELMRRDVSSNFRNVHV